MLIDQTSLHSVSHTTARFEQFASCEGKPTDLRKKIQKMMCSFSFCSFVCRSESIWSLLAGYQQIGERIDVFKKTFEEKIKLIQQKSWNSLKKEWDIQMTRPSEVDNLSLEEFRDKANSFVNELTQSAILALGLPKVSFCASGTRGYGSDVDITIVPEERMSLEESYIAKCLRDSAHANLLKGHSGIQLDTETYSPHVASQETSKKLTTSAYKIIFTTTEYAMAILQARVSFRDSNEWTSFCSQEICNTSPERQKTVEAIMKQVEIWYDSMNFEVLKQVLVENPTSFIFQGLPPNFSRKDIQDKLSNMTVEAIKEQVALVLARDPEAYEKAAKNQKLPTMLRVATFSSSLDDQIQKIREIIKQKNLPPITKNYLTATLQEMLISVDLYSKMLGSLQSGSTFAQSEGSVTLLKEGGQQDCCSFKEVHRAFKRKVIEMELQSSGLPRSVQMEIEALRYNLKIQRQKWEAPSIQELTLAAYEEQQQFAHVIREGLEEAATSANPDQIARETIISAGKYCLRTIRNKLRAMELVEQEFAALKKPLPKGFQPLRVRMKNAEREALCLEQCKRKFRLNHLASLNLLHTAAIDNALENEREIDAVQVKRDLTQLIRRWENEDILNDDTLLKREKMNYLIREMTMGLIEEVIVTNPPVASSIRRTLPKEENIKKILQAMVGYSRVKEKHEDLNTIFQEGDQITLKAFDLTSVSEVESFAKKIETLSQSWQNMAFEAGILNPLSDQEWVSSEMDFLRYWEEAKNSIYRSRETEELRIIRINGLMINPRSRQQKRRSSPR